MAGGSNSDPDRGEADNYAYDDYHLHRVSQHCIASFSTLS